MRLKLSGFLYACVSCVAFSHIALSEQALSNSCFIATSNGQEIAIDGNCQKRVSPCQSFDIPLSVIGYDLEILRSSKLPEWKYQAEYANWSSHLQDIEKHPHDPASWMKNSVQWYAQVLAQKIGQDEIEAYLAKFDYGNKDLSGTTSKSNALIQSWMSSSLEISPVEQVAFMDKLAHQKLPISAEAQQKARKLMAVEDFSMGWTLHSKSASCACVSGQKGLMGAWYVGYVHQDDASKGKKSKSSAEQDVIAFVQYAEGVDAAQATKAAQEVAIQKLLQVITQETSVRK